MSDYFIHNSKNIIPEYNPGIIGYSQPGAPGDNGEIGNSVYYTAYDLTPESPDISKCVTKILRNNELSDNYDSSLNGRYGLNDLIIDKNGYFYKITTLSKLDAKISPCYDIEKIGYSRITELFTGFDVYCNTSFLKSSARKWVQSNPYYDSAADNNRIEYSPKTYHHNRLEKNIYGNFIKFNLACKSQSEVSNYLYKFVLVLPSGRLLEYYSEEQACVIFLENKLLMGEYSRNEGRMFADFVSGDIKYDPSKDSSIGNSDLELDIDDEYATKSMFEILQKYVNDSSAFELSQDTNLEKITTITNNNIKLSDIYYNGLESKEFSILCSYFIKEECHAYVEITSKSNGIVYRIDVTDKFIKEDSTENTENLEYIDKAMNTISWKTKEYQYETGGFIKYENEDGEICVYNPFNCYAFFSYDNKADYDVQMSENEEVEYVHFIDASGMGTYLKSRSKFFLNDMRTEEDGFFDNYINENEGYKTAYVKSEIVKDVVDDKIAEKIVNYHVVNDDDNTNILEIETAQKYGLCEEMSTDINYDKDFNRTLRLTFGGVSSISLNIIYEKLKEPLVKENGEVINYPQALVYVGYPDVPLLELNDPETAGIWYLTKFVPPGYYIDSDESEYVKTSFGGITDTRINLQEFNKDDGKTHFVEIGITLLDMDVRGANRRTINSAHRPSFVINEDGVPLTIDKYSFINNLEGSSGTPDLKLYVTRVTEAQTIIKNELEENLDAFFTSIHRDFPENMILS